MLQKLLIIGFLSASAFLPGCGLVYRMDVQQGNIVTQDMLDKLELGMSQDKVRFVMGSPMLVDIFHPERWEYFHSLKQGGEEVQRRRVVLFFDGGRLAKISGDAQADLPEPASERPAEPDLPIL